MKYYVIANVILIFFFLSFIYLIILFFKKGYTTRELISYLIYSLFITFLFKYSYSFHFLGLEYEDSYIFNFSARQLSNNIYPVSFLTDSINVGSLTEPVYTATYGGHFIAYPVLISWIYRFFGYNIYIPSYLNTFIEFLSILTLSISFKRVFGYQKYWFIPGLIYCLAPAMNLFGTTHLSETFSSFIILICILSFFYYFQSNRRLILIIFSIDFFTALLTKRENTVLIIFILFFSCYKVFVNKMYRFSNLLPLIITIILFILYLALVQDIFSIERIESEEILNQTFSFNYFINQVPVFIKALINIKWFNIFLLILILSIIFIAFNWKKHTFYLSLLVLYFSYFLVYTLHYRSYYFVHFGDIKPFDTLRYLNNFFVISTLIISFFLHEVLDKYLMQKVVFSILSLLLIVSFAYTHLLRQEFSDIELENRFLNPKLVIKYLSDKEESVLIADNILIFQLLGDNDLDIIDIFSLEIVPNEYKNRSTYIFLTSFNKTKYFQYRFPNIFRKMQMMKMNEVIKFDNNDSLYKIE